MKRVKILLPIVIITYLSLFLTGCNENDEAISSDIIGTWTNSAISIDITVDGKSIVEYLVDAFGWTEAIALPISSPNMRQDFILHNM